MPQHLKYLIRITWCRITGGHDFVIARSLDDGAPLSTSCARCPLLEAGE